MLKFQGKNLATVMIDNIDEETRKQIVSLSNHPAFNTDMVIMPDCHKGAGCVIGYTRPLENDIVPNLVGVDISCGVCVSQLEQFDIESLDFKKFDRYVKQNIPMGFSISNNNNLKKLLPNSSRYQDYVELCKKVCSNGNLENFVARVSNSVGTIGGGNHYLELDVSTTEQLTTQPHLYVSVHTGSRNLGKQVAEFYQQKAVEFCDRMKIAIDKDVAYIPIEYGGDEYLESMKLCQEYAKLNRQEIMDVVERYFIENHKVGVVKTIESVHNYFDFEDNMIRKGAISAHKGQELVIPLNMRDGVIIGVGKGNIEWNNSSPHGSGRILSRHQAKKQVKLEDFQETMKGIYSSTINTDTLDESPFAYKPTDIILEAIKDTVDIVQVIKPIYNVKSGKE